MNVTQVWISVSTPSWEKNHVCHIKIEFVSFQPGNVNAVLHILSQLRRVYTQVAIYSLGKKMKQNKTKTLISIV